MAKAAGSVAFQSEMQEMIELFLSPDFDPLKEEDGGHNFHLEGEVEFSDGGSDEEDQSVYKREEHLRACGRKLAHMGDDYLKSRQANRQGAGTNFVDTVRDTIQNVASVEQSSTKSLEEKKQAEERGWEVFRDTMSNAVAGTGVDDAYRYLGAFLLTLHGLGKMSSCATKLVKDYSMRFAREQHLGEAVQRMGGLDAVMRAQTD